MSDLLRRTEALIRDLRQEPEPTGLRDDCADQHPHGGEPTTLAPSVLNSEPAGNPLEQFLSDATLPAAIFHSYALDMDFILARDEAALEALIKADQALPVIYFAECPELAKLPLQGLKAVLDLRQVFGPAAQLRNVAESRDA